MTLMATMGTIFAWMMMRDQKSMEKLQLEGSDRKCPECGSNKVEYEKEELVCKKCGLVIE